MNHWVLERLAKAHIPVILLDRCIYPYPRRSSYDLIGIDNRRAGFRMTEHLLQHFCRRLLFFAKPHSAVTVQARIQGFRDAVSQTSGCSGDVHIGDPDDREEIKKQVLNYSTDGIVCANDVTAAHLMQTLQTLGEPVPKQVRVVGIDDVKYAGLLPIPLTTLRQPCRQLGETALSVLLDRIARPDLPARDILLDCELIVRDSCGTHCPGPKSDAGAPAEQSMATLPPGR